jgi:DNA-binding GntR family transcriptional regulator
VAAGTTRRALAKLAAEGLIVVSGGRRAIVAAGSPGTATGT